MIFRFNSPLFRAAVLAALVLGSAASPTSAAPVLDQSNLYPTNVSLGGNPVSGTQGNYREAAQTFTIGISGLLTTLQIQLGGEVQRAVTVDIRQVSNVGQPPPAANASALASFTVTSPKWPACQSARNWAPG